MADEYIRRDTAINEVICAVYWALNQHGNVNGQVIIDKFSSIPSVNIPQWIPVEENLPRRYEDVLVSAKDIPKPIVAWLGSSGFRDALGGCLDVTHWMPLPEPPKEET